MAADQPKKLGAESKPKASSVREALNRIKAEEPPHAAKEPPVAAAAPAAPAPPAPSRTHEIGHIAPNESSRLNMQITFGQPGLLDLAIFCRQFATLSEVGIPVLKALKMLSGRTAHPRLRKAIADVANGVEEGQPIHQGMARNVHTFTPLVVNIVQVGEVGGILEDSLVRLAEIMESKAKIRRKVKSASMYPAVAGCVAIGAVMLIMTKAIPVFAEVYSTTGHADEMPRMTQIIISLSHVFVATWWLILIVLVGAIAGVKFWGRTPGGTRFFSTLWMHTPVIRGITQKIGTARFSRSLGSLLKAGIPLTEAILITADSCENTVIADALRDVRKTVETGEQMNKPLAKARVFPPMVVDMIAIGEETGTLDTMLEKIAEIYEEEVDATLTGLSSIIEPLLILTLGGVVIFIAMAVLLPYFNLVHVVGVD